MKIVSKRIMVRDYPKLAWRIAFIGFNRRSEPQYHLYGKKEALEQNPKMEYSMAGNSNTLIGVY